MRTSKPLVAMRLVRTIVLIGGLVSAAAAQAAVTIINRDEEEHTITIIEGDSKKDYVLKPSQTLNDVCEKGCQLRIHEDDEDDPYVLKPNVSVSIEDGVLYFEPDAPAPATTAPPKGGSDKGVKG